jgi:hypothetical protein
MPRPRWFAPLLVVTACNSPGGADDDDDADTGAATTSGTVAGSEDGADATAAATTTSGGVDDTSSATQATSTEAGTGVDTGTDSGTDSDTDGDSGPDHDGALGCPGVYNPDQILDLHLAMAPGDWQTVLGDMSFSIYVEAEFHCGDEAPITVGVRRKRSGGLNKVGLKVDFNELVKGQRWHDLRKLSLENGVSSGANEDGAEVRDLVSEYLGWRIVQRAGVVGSRAAFADLHVNGELVGAYVNVEQVDTRFLKDRFGDNDGWLVKKSGGDGDGPQTHEDDGMADPYAAYFCFWEKGGQACEPPPVDVLLAELPTHLDIPKMLRMGAVNAYIANTDSPLFKDNNWYYYDWAGGGRIYMPTDLDTTMKDCLA